MLQSIAEGQQQGLAQAGRAAASIDRLSPEQKNRIKELERQQALGLLGLDAGQQQRILSQQLQPVQAAEREAIRRSAQGQMIGDVGQGSTFRGQQALLEASGRARTQATSAAQQQIAELDELARARQLNELAQLRQQQQQNRASIADMVSGIIGGKSQQAAGIIAAPEVAATQREEREIAMLDAKSRADEARAALEKKTINKVSDKTVSGNDYFESLEQFAIEDIVEDIVTPPAAPPAAPPVAPPAAPPVVPAVVPAPTPSGSITPEQMIATVLGSVPFGIPTKSLIRSTANMLYPETVKAPLNWTDKMATITQDPLTGEPTKVEVSGLTWTPGNEGWSRILKDIEEGKNKKEKKAPKVSKEPAPKVSKEPTANKDVNAAFIKDFSLSATPKILDESLGGSADYTELNYPYRNSNKFTTFQIPEAYVDYTISSSPIEGQGKASLLLVYSPYPFNVNNRAASYSPKVGGYKLTVAAGNRNAIEASHQNQILGIKAGN